MNLPCTLVMLYSCFNFPEIEDREFLLDHGISGLASDGSLIGGRAGSELLAPIVGEDVPRREEKILAWLKQGNWPKKLSRFKAVQVMENGHHLVYWVMADYLSLGNDADFVLMPLSWVTAKSLLKQWNMLLPTAKMVDQIFQQAERIHWPHAFPPSDAMRSTPYLLNHNAWIQAVTQLEFIDHPLIAGHKKDLVVSPRLLTAAKRVAIYGWHNLANGAAIQPLSLWHGDFYVDYSHGLRLVAPEAELDGKRVALKAILKDPDLAPLVSFEGAFDICEVLNYPC